MVGKELDVGTVDLDPTSSNLLQVLLAAEGSETPVLGDNDLLATRELVLGSAKSLKSDGAVWRNGLVQKRRTVEEYKVGINILESRVRTLIKI